MGKNNHALITGVFLLILTTATVGIIFWIGNFQQERNLYVISTIASVTGLNPQSTVFFRGIAVGKVLRVEFDPDNSGIILIPIEVDKKVVLTKDVYATLQLKGVTGLTQVGLEDKGVTVEPLPTGNQPQFRIPLVPSLTDKLLTSGEELLKKADRIMIKVSSFMNDENEKNVGEILYNLNGLTAKLSTLQQSVDKALLEVPKLGENAANSLQKIDQLTKDLRNLTAQLQTLSQQAQSFADTSNQAGFVLLKTTLPKINGLLTDLQSTTKEVKKLSSSIKANPQALLLGPGKTQPAPGEPAYKEQP